jgi:hypothetical protein
MDFGGPGIGMGGESGSAFQNDVSLGNILIVHEHVSEIIGGSVADPDDETGPTTITIVFPEPVTLFSFDMIDREMNESQNVELFDEFDVLIDMFDTPDTGDNGVGMVATDMGAPGSGTPGVMKIVMNHRGSGGLDNIVFEPPPPPPPPPGGCSYTIGFWKNHTDVWPVGSLTLGGVLYNQTELLAILNQAPKGDKTIILAHQLIGAKLNLENGADPTALGTTIADADAWLAAHGGVGSGLKDWDGARVTRDGRIGRAFTFIRRRTSGRCASWCSSRLGTVHTRRARTTTGSG